MVHFAFYEYLKAYQDRRGGGSPRIYRRAALAVLLAECFEDFGKLGRKAVIHDESIDADRGVRDHARFRQPEYDSAFARFLVAFCDIIQFDEVPRHNDHSLDKYRQILRKRVDQRIPRITEQIRSSLKAPQVVEIIKTLDRVKG